MRKMKQAGCRHLPVEKDRFLGVVSLRDLLQVDLSEKDEEIRWLNAYIHYVPPESRASTSPSSRTLPAVRIVLVRPDTAANVGACARVVRNTGWPGSTSSRPATGARSSAGAPPGGRRTCSSRRASSRTSRRPLPDAHARWPSPASAAGALPPRTCARPPQEVAALAEDETASLVFGPETSGLTLAELALCGRTATIPTHPFQPSLNLSHAVMVAAYEVFRAGRRADASPAPGHPRREGAHARPAGARGWCASRALPDDEHRRATSASGSSCSPGPTSRRRKSSSSSTWRAR